MTKSIFTIFTLMFVLTISKAQTTALQFTGPDCNGNAVDLFADLDAGKAVILHFYMPNCTTCPPVAQKIQKMAKNVLAQYPGMVKGYAFPFQNSTTCAYSTSWVTTNKLTELYAPMINGATHVAHYGGFGMPTVVVLGGKDHKVLFSTLSFSTSDTTIMRDKILELLKGTTGTNELPAVVNSFNVFPNPANNNISVKLDLKEASNLQVDILDMTGKQVAVIMNKNQKGVFTEQFNIATLPNGNYLVRLQVNGKSVSEKLSIIH